jgi:hypothetical protein
MEKIKPLSNCTCSETVRKKIDELVKALNELSDHTHSCGNEVTSEPEIYVQESNPS